MLRTPTKSLHFLLPQIHKDCFSKGGSKSTTLQQVPIRDGLIQSALKSIRDFLSPCFWGLDPTSMSEMASAACADILMQSLLQKCQEPSRAISPSVTAPLRWSFSPPRQLQGEITNSSVSQLKCQLQKWILLKYILFLIWKDILKDYFRFQQPCLFFRKILYSGQKKKKKEITGFIFRSIYQVIERHLESKNYFHFVKCGNSL